MDFWIVIIALALGVAATLAAALLRRSSDSAAPAEQELAVYRDQLREVEADLARGTLTQEAAERLRTEISRRILAADKARQVDRPGTAPNWVSLVAAGLVTLLLFGGSLALYGRLGQPGYADQPLASRLDASRQMAGNRPSQAAAEAQAEARRADAPPPDPRHAALVERLRAALQERGNVDPRGLRLLAENEAALGNFTAARQAQARVIDARGEAAAAADWSAYADLLILAAGGYVSPEAEAALAQALSRDPDDPAARYYSGQLFAQTGRPDLAFRAWKPLLDESAPDDPWNAAIRAQIEAVAAAAGIDYRLPQASTAPGPDAADISAAEEMDPQARAEMIRGMVGGLAERLASEGGPPSDWARLIGALGVLGEAERARAIWREGRQVFSEDAEAVALLDQAADRAGLSP